MSWIRWCSFLGLLSLVACGGQGCNGCSALTAIPGGFPLAQRQQNAVELRVTQDFFTFLQQNATGLINSFIPGGKIPIPSTCTGDTQICCGQMCNIDANFTSLNFTPQPPQTTQMTIRAMLKTDQNFNVKIKQGIVDLSCQLSYDSTRSGKPDVGIVAGLLAQADPTTLLTSLSVPPNSISLTDIDDGDITISGDLTCQIANLLKGLLINTLTSQIEKQISGPLNQAFCQKCQTSADCSPLATQGCSAQNFCTRDNACLDHLGVEGQVSLSGLLGAGTAPLDVYAVAGGYATVEATPAGGLSLGMLGGTQAATRSSCVPDRPIQMLPPPPKTADYSGSTAPNGMGFDVGVGISTLELNLLGHGIYDSGALCLSLGTAQVSLLSSQTLGVLVPSLADLTRGHAAALSLSLRPQQPPTFVLGKGTFTTNAMGATVIDDPLLTVTAPDFAIDFYVYMDERYVRFLRLTADLALPVGIEVDNMGRLVPILGDLGKAFQNLRVSDTALLKESPETLASLFPTLLPILLGQISTSISPITLPTLMNFQLKPVQITSTAGDQGMLQFLGLFLQLGVVQGMAVHGEDREGRSAAAIDLQSRAAALGPVHTTAELVALQVPPAAELRLTTPAAQRKAVQVSLRLGGQGPSQSGGGGGALEWQLALDGGMWRPFDSRREITLAEPVLSLPGTHHISVRARVVGAPESLDPTPVQVEFVVQPAPSSIDEVSPAASTSALPPTLGAVTPAVAAVAAGCSAAGATGTGGSVGKAGSPGWADLLCLLGVFFAAAQLRRRHALRAGLLLLGFGLVAGCANGNSASGQSGYFAPGDEIGRYDSAAVNNGTLYVSAYNSNWGDLAYSEIKDPQAAINWQVVDGLPSGLADITTPGAPRHGYSQPGPDVGRFTSLALNSKGVPVIAYQDITNGAVKLAIGPAPNWQISVVDAGGGSSPSALPGQYGMFIQLILSSADVPTVSYMVAGAPSSGKFVGELVVSTARTGQPQSPSDWNRQIVETATASCAGLCPSGQACVLPAGSKDPLTSTCQAVGTGCAPACTAAQACMNKACVAALTTPATDIPQGTGLYAKLLPVGGGTLVFYNHSQGALKMASAPAWNVVTIDGGTGKPDVGMQVGATSAADGTIHLVYADAAMSQVFYRTVKGGTVAAAIQIDDGARTVSGTAEQHLVGGGAVVFLNNGTPNVAYQDQTGGTLEVATGGPSWTHQTLGAVPGSTGGTGGFYPQAVQLGGNWIVLNVVYSRTASGPLSSLTLTPL